MPDPTIIIQAEQLVKRIKKSVEQRIKEINKKLSERKINETLIDLVPKNKKEIENDNKRKCESMGRAWTQKDKYIRESLETKRFQIDYNKETLLLKKESQQERVE